MRDRNKLATILFILHLAFLGISLCSNVTLTSSPGAISPLLTPTLTLKCQLYNTIGSASSGSLVGRDLSSSPDDLVGRDLSSSPDDIVGRDLSSPDDLSSSPDDLLVLTSIVIIRDGHQDVARVTSVTSPEPIGDHSSTVHVDGDLRGQSGGVRGFLQVSWEYPQDEQVGEYSCEVNGVNAGGHGVTLTVATDVVRQEVSTYDLVMHIHNLTLADKKHDATVLDQQKQISDQQKQISDQQKQISEQQKHISDQQRNNSAQQKQISDQQTEISDQQKHISSLEAAIKDLAKNDTDLLDTLSHTETGIAQCLNSNTWPVHATNFNVKGVTVKFSRPYTSVPTVHLALQRLDVATGKNTWFEITLDSVDHSGFVFSCWAWKSPDWLIDQLYVSWLSVPH